MLAFSLVAVMIVIAGFVSWIAFGSLGNVIKRIEEHNLPAITLSAELAEKGAAVVATAPLLIASKTEAEQSETWADLRLLFLDMVRLSRELDKYSETPEAIKKLKSLIDEITENLIKLDHHIKLKISFSTRILEKADRLRWIHADFLDEIDPIITDARFNLESAMDNIKQPGQTRGTLEIFQKESTKQEAILRVNALGNLVVGLLARGSSAPDLDTLNDTVHFHKEIISLGNGGDGLFAMRQKQLVSLEKSYHLLEKNRKLVDALRNEIEHQVTAAKTASQSAMARSEHLVKQGKIMLLSAMMASLMAAFLVGWFYVARNLTARIKKLSHAMHSIATGNLQTPVPTGGRDEISSMAQSLLIFRNTASAMEEANAQAIINNTQVGLITTRMNGRIEYFNPTAMELFECEEAGLPADNFEELITGENLNQIRDFFKTSHYDPSRQLLSAKTSGKRKSGSVIPINILSQPLNKGRNKSIS